jgi:16S rRNA (cytosine967-C5)-methyltransferase
MRDMDLRDRHFVSALVYSVLEHKLTIDYVIDGLLTKRNTDKTVRVILRIGCAQILYMDVPDSAAVNETVKLMNSTGKKALKGFVNAVLRKVCNVSLEDIRLPDESSEPDRYLSVKYSYPEWIVRMLRDQYGEQCAREILSYKRSDRHGILVRVISGRGSVRSTVTDNAVYHKNAVYIEGSDIDNNPDYIEGLITPQSEASMFCVEAAGITRGGSVLDLCAAPGGKSAYAYEFSGTKITACDVYEHRIEVMRKNLQRLRIEYEAVRNDGCVLNPDFIDRFDYVLVDAPCSSLGLMYRKPELRYSKSMADLDAIAAVQSLILDNASKYVRPGGILIYSTCTVNKAENEYQIKDFLNEHSDFSGAGFTDSTLKRLAGKDDFQIQLLPNINDTDGFYIARLVKR